MRRRVLLALAIAAAALACGCTETVANFSLELSAPALSPPLTCPDGDPRRIETLVLRFEYDSETIVVRHGVADGTFGLSDIPLGQVTVAAEGLNSAGRTVASGEVFATIERGQNTPLKIALLAEDCLPGSACDPDGDGLASADEVALGLAADVRDSDGDGLDDGLELQSCCSNPLDPRDADRCKLLIKQVVPMLGPAGESVVIKATKALDNPAVQLGGAPLDSPLLDVTTVFGRVGAQAVLGEVHLDSGGSKQTYSGLFAVLERDPELIFELDQRAGGKTNLMQRLVDMLAAKDGLFMLGNSGSGTSGSNTNAGGGVVLQLSADRKEYRRVVLPTKGQPVALALGDAAVLALVRESSTQSAVVSIGPSVGTPIPATKVIRLDTAGKTPIGLLSLPAKGGLLVLYSDGIARYNADGTGGRLTTLTQVARDPNSANGSPGTPLPPGTIAGAVVRGCTGMALGAASSSDPTLGGDLYIACNAALANCKAPAPCARVGALLRVRDVAKCLGSAAGTSLAGCITLHYSAGADLIGHPLIDTRRRRVYVLSDGGVLFAPLASGTATPLGPVAPFAPAGRGRGARQMALDGRGLLYVANGPTVLRIDPNTTDLGKRARPIIVGKDSERAMMLTTTPDGATLDIGREKIADSLLTVCIARCNGCACQ